MWLWVWRLKTNLKSSQFFSVPSLHCISLLTTGFQWLGPIKMFQVYYDCDLLQFWQYLICFVDCDQNSSFSFLFQSLHFEPWNDHKHHNLVGKFRWNSCGHSPSLSGAVGVQTVLSRGEAVKILFPPSKINLYLQMPIQTSSLNGAIHQSGSWFWCKMDEIRSLDSRDGLTLWEVKIAYFVI